MRTDVGSLGPVVQLLGCMPPGPVVVLRDQEGHKTGWQFEEGEVRGRECRDHADSGQDGCKGQHRFDPLAGQKHGPRSWTEAHPVSDQVPQSPRRRTDRRPPEPHRIEPCAMDARDHAAPVGDLRQQGRPRLPRALGRLAIVGARMEAQSARVNIGDAEAALLEVALGRGTPKRLP